MMAQRGNSRRRANYGSVQGPGGHEGMGCRHGNHRRDRGGHSGGRVDLTRMQCISEEELQALSQGGPEEVLVCVNENEGMFLNTFKVRKYCHHPMHLKRMVKLLYFLVKCEDQSTASKMLAQILCADGDYASFTTQIDQLLKKMAFETRGYIKRENIAFLDHLIEIGSMAIKTIPSTVGMTFPVTVMGHTIEELTELGENMRFISTRFEEMNSAFKRVKLDAVREARKKVSSEASKESEGEPPEPFTELPVLPRREEIHIQSEKVFLRANKIKGGYNNCDHYFDVQFRLLREDFVRPLREGISIFCDTGSTRKTSDIRVYEEAKILNPVCLYAGMGFQLRFDASKFSRVNWEHSRRLIFGSLLCLSNDNFDRCLLFATVVKRDPKLLQEGLLTIKFEGDVNGFQIDPNEAYTMVESTAYYEAYCHVLKSMQEISLHPDAVPMKKYIMECDFADVKVPVFLRPPAIPPHFNMVDILGRKDAKGRPVLQRKVFNISHPDIWPQASSTNLDESQLRALKMALTKEVSVIQGPPGTGKTYIGLKIVEAYLRNREVWDPQRAAPILIVCYTNHALDQFLEEIQKIIIENSCPSIIRVGGRCKSAALENCVLSKKVQECRANRSVPRHLFRAFMDARTALFNSQDFINSNMQSCDAESKQKIIHLINLEAVIDPNHVDQLRYASESAMNKEIEVWLKLWFPEEEEAESAEMANLQPHEASQAALFPEHEDASSSDEEYIQVDNEARILQEERMIQGEEVEVHSHINDRNSLRVNTAVPKQPKKTGDKDGWKTVQLTEGQRKKKISKGFKNTPMSRQEAIRVHDIWKLSDSKRWQLYLHWTNKYIKYCKDRVNTKAQAYNFICMQYGESQRNIDCHVAQGADVIGMTTTGAAKYHHLLRQIHPKIVIFEEAAEVLEAHVITSLASSVQQLIMIGDHKQLKPKPTCYDLEKYYNLDTSLFERFINNGFEHVTLEKQHRMRPEISRLLCPSIYEKLEDADNVKNYDHVVGVGKDLFFIEHTKPEESNDFNDTKSHVNKFEAEYVVELCHYLLKQGAYSPHDITILTMYRGQLLELKKRMKREHFEGVRVAAVDDFQGEENEIILLSLVRSNSERSTGFLKIENRVCVSLSRAKKGLYVIGNLHMLREENETKWPEIIHHLEKEQRVGPGLPLYCQVHPEDKTVIRTPAEFRQRPEGGCTRMCGMRLDCGHVCERICHPKDREHKLVSCSKTCGKNLPCGHTCKGKCYQCKKSKCRPCAEHVQKKLPYCGHTVTLRCSVDTKFTECPLPCEKTLPCGHKCQNTCSVGCTIECHVKVKKSLPCGHCVSVHCFEDPSSVVCPVKCEQMLECGDRCSGTCGKCHRGRLHVECRKKCDRDLVCGHICKYPCASICPPCEEPCNNYCFHSKCPKKCYELCKPCMEPCEWVCPHFQCTKPCGDVCNRPRCDRPCDKTLECGHPCIGLCGEKCPDKCRICNKDEVCEIFFGNEDDDSALFIQLQDCGHVLEVHGLDEWVKIENSSSGSTQVQFKTCPRCKAFIRKSMRYGNIIKQVLSDVEAIKRKQMQSSDSLEVELHKVKKQLKEMGSLYVSEDLECVKSRIHNKSSTSNWYRCEALKFQLTVFPRLVQINLIISANLKQVPGINIADCSQRYLEDCLFELKTFIMQEFLSSQQIFDSTSELRRLTCAAKLLDLLCKIRLKKCVITSTDNKNITHKIEQAYFSGWNRERTTEEDETAINSFIHELSTKYQVDGLSQEEKLQIVNAVGLSKGHWYKCPNGHFYCIGECGGAMQKAKCPECGHTIGGTNHTLAAGNLHAGEMDGSRHAAWSDAANLANFDPADLARLRL